MSGSFKPLPMIHPSFAPATKGVSPDRRKGLPGTKGHATRFPPMTASNPDEEEFLRSRGYLPNPKGRLPQMMVDGEAVTVREDAEGGLDMIPIAQPAAPINGTAVMSPAAYPRYVGKVRVDSAEEHKALLEAQEAVHDLPDILAHPFAVAAPVKRQTVPAAQPAPTAAPASPEIGATAARIDILEKNVRQIMDAVNGLLEAAKPKPSADEERAKLRLEAKNLRLKFDGRLSTLQLRELIEKAKAPASPPPSPPEAAP